MALYKKLRKTVSKARKGIRSVAKSYLKYKRTPLGKMLSKRVKNYGFSSTAVAKSIYNMNRKIAVSAEHKTLDQFHQTVGTADNATRNYFRIASSGVLAKELPSVGGVTGNAGYLLRQLNYPSKGDGVSDYDGQKFSVESIQWKGSVALGPSAQGNTNDGQIKMFIVEYKDDDDSAFAMNEFLETDMNGEYSTASRRNRNFWKDYKVIATRTFNLRYGTQTRKDFNIFVKPKKIVRHLDNSSATIPIRYMMVAVASPDIADKTTYVDYQGFTRLRFIH